MVSSTHVFRRHTCFDLVCVFYPRADDVIAQFLSSTHETLRREKKKWKVKEMKVKKSYYYCTIAIFYQKHKAHFTVLKTGIFLDRKKEKDR